MEVSSNFSLNPQPLIHQVKQKNLHSYTLFKNTLRLTKYIKLLFGYILLLLFFILLFFFKSLSVKSSVAAYQKQKSDLNDEINSIQNSFNGLVSENGQISNNLFNILTLKFSLESQYLNLTTEYDLAVLRKLFNKDVSLKKIYQATLDGTTPKAFHEKCDTHSPSVVVITTKDGDRFGGFTHRSWDGHSMNKEDTEAFVFNLDKMERYDIDAHNTKEAIFTNELSFPIFGRDDININRVFDANDHSSGFPTSYGDSGDSSLSLRLSNGNKNFGIRDIVAFHVTFLNEDN